MDQAVSTSFALVLALAFACGSRQAVGAEPSDPQLERLAVKYLGLIRTEDPTPLTEVAKMLSDDFIQSTSSGAVHKGKADNMALYRKSVAETQAVFRRLAVSFEVQSVRRFSKTAVVFGKITMAGDLKEGGTPFRREVWETIVFRKHGTDWLMVHEHSSRAKGLGESRR